MINYDEVFKDVAGELSQIDDLGEVASYIPELSWVDSSKFGVHLSTVSGEHYSYGDSNEKFSIQSIAKVLSLALALKLVGEGLLSRVGVEPSGSAFNSLVQLEYEKGIPRNPFINAGAVVICDALISHMENPRRELLDFIREISGNSDINYCARVAESEIKSGYRNRSLANLMKDFGNIHNDIDEVLDLYFNLCSIEMTCKEVAETFLFLASDGFSLIVNRQILSAQRAKRINAIMLTCGFYDEAGEFAFRAGLPGKSGVGGGIVAIHPGEYSIVVWSPKLNQKGNSYKGMRMLEAFTTKTQSSIF